MHIMRHPDPDPQLRGYFIVLAVDPSCIWICIRKRTYQYCRVVPNDQRMTWKCWFDVKEDSFDFLRVVINIDAGFGANEEFFATFRRRLEWKKRALDNEVSSVKSFVFASTGRRYTLRARLPPFSLPYSVWPSSSVRIERQSATVPNPGSSA